MSGRAEFIAYQAKLEGGEIDKGLEAEAFAAARAALERIEACLRRIGYRFWCEEEDPPRPPLQDTPRDHLADLMTFHQEVWPVPHAVRAAATHLGEVDFRQAPEQGRPRTGYEPNPSRTPLESLCEYDPICFETRYAVDSIQDVLDVHGNVIDVRSFEFAPDAYHKADISGGGGYAVDCRETALDPHVELAGMSFLKLIDETLARGGFLGALSAPGPKDPYGHDGPRAPLPQSIGEILRQAAAWD